MKKIDILNIFLAFALVGVIGIGTYREKKNKKENIVIAENYEKQQKLELSEKQAVNPLYKKNIVFNGDSIMYGAGFTGGFAKMIAYENDMTYKNLAEGGATIATNTYYTGEQQRYWLTSSVDSINSEADYIILEGGINDYWNNVPLGEVTDSNSNFDETTFSGALESMFKKSKEKWPDKKIGFIITHKIDTTCLPHKNDIGLGFESYRNQIVEACNKWEIPYLDLFSESGIDTSSEEVKKMYFYQADGVHPNEQGYRKFYVDKVTEWLKKL